MLVRAGQVVRVTDVAGGQVGDLFAFGQADPGEYASAEHTRPAIERLFPRPGDLVLTSRRRPILTLVEDTSPGRHDTLPASSRPGDFVAFRAEPDCLVILSACPMDIVPISTGGITPLELRADG